MIKVLTVDDEPKNLRILKELLRSYCPQVDHVGEAESMEKAIEMIHTLQPELVLLDIEMPHGNAFDLLDKIMPVDFEIVFVTAFETYTLKAFKYSALDYLLKPVNIDELKNAILKAQHRVDQKNFNLQLTNLLNNLRQKESSHQKIAIPSSNGGFEFISFNEIVFCEANGPYTYIITDDGRKLVSSKNIKEFEEILPASVFFRSHHSFLINLSKVKKYIKGRGGEVEMENGSVIELAIRRKDDFLKRIKL
ncbi:MAG: LytTR family DNA-binding domain-containing protein [Lacibacter sp.]